MSVVRHAKHEAGFKVSHDSVCQLDTGSWQAHLRLTFPDGIPQQTSQRPDFADQLLAQLPALRTHRCDNGTARSFEMELRDTEVAHAFEHICIELLAQAHPQVPRTSFQGKTGYDFSIDGSGVYRVVITGFRSEEEVEKIAEGAYKIIMQSLRIV